MSPFSRIYYAPQGRKPGWTILVDSSLAQVGLVMTGMEIVEKEAVSAKEVEEVEDGPERL